MRIARLLIVPWTLVALAFGHGVARAASTVVTPAMSQIGGDLTCRIVNTGTTPITVDVELVNDGGVVVVSTTGCALPPGRESCSAGGNPAVGYCRFTLTVGSKKKARAAILRNEPGYGTVAALPAE